MHELNLTNKNRKEMNVYPTNTNKTKHSQLNLNA